MGAFIAHMIFLWYNSPNVYWNQEQTGDVAAAARRNVRQNEGIFDFGGRHCV